MGSAAVIQMVLESNREDLAGRQAWRHTSSCAHVAGDNPFKIRAFRKAAGIIAEHPQEVTCGADMKGVAGVGKGTMALVRSMHMQEPSEKLHGNS